MLQYTICTQTNQSALGIKTRRDDLNLLEARVERPLQANAIQQLKETPAFLTRGRIVSPFPLRSKQILLPYVIAALFGIGYGSVVAAGGWEALQVQPNPNGPGGGGNSSCVDDGDGGGDGAGGSSQSGYRGGSTGRGGLVRTTSQISFAQQVCARDNRAEQEAQAHADDEYDDDDIDSSGPGSDTDDADANRHRGPTSPAVAITASPADRVPVSNRSQPRAGNSGDREHVTDAPANERRDGGDGGSDGNPTRASTTVDFETTPPRIPDALHVRLPAEGRGDVSRSSDDDGETRRCDGSGTGSGGPAGGLAMIHQASGDESTEPEDEEDEEEDGGGWGQVVVKPVKVARWDKQGRRSKTRLSLNQLRALIIERAESTPQRSTYKRAAKLVRGRVEAPWGWGYILNKVLHNR